MRLWKAILKGSKMKPQCFGGLYKDGGSCAMGAANDGLNGKKHRDTMIIQMLNCPSCGDTIKDRQNTDIYCWGSIPHLNDVHKWTREAIAEWVRVQEKNIIMEKWAKRQASRKPINVKAKEIIQIKDGQLCLR